MKRILYVLLLLFGSFFFMLSENITFKYSGNVSSVYLAGDFNGWSNSSHPMIEEKGGRFWITVDLSPGTYYYKYIVNGQWIGDMSSIKNKISPQPSGYQNDGYGGKNAYIIVEDVSNNNNNDDYSGYNDSGNNDASGLNGSEQFVYYSSKGIKRLTKNPQDNNFFIDPKLCREWKWLQVVFGTYRLYVKYIKLNSDGTGYLDIAEMYLNTGGTMSYKTHNDANIIWGIKVINFDDGSKLTALNIYGGGTSIWFYYAFIPDTNTTALVEFDPSTMIGKNGGNMIWDTSANFDANWNTNLLWVTKALRNQSINDQIIMMNMHMTTMNIINNF